MSCQHPIHLANNAINWRKNLDSLYNLVNCGKCPSCLKDITDGFYVRARFHYHDTLGYDFNGKKVKQGGFCLFPTLTYRPCFRPKKRVCIDGKEFDIKGFSYQHIRNYVKLVQDRFHDVYPESDQNVTYLIASEYGYNNEYVSDSGKVRRGENAPHYHALFFFPKDAQQSVSFIEKYKVYDRKQKKRITKERVKTLCGRTYWKNYLCESWQYGNVDYSKEFGAYVGERFDENSKIVTQTGGYLKAIKYVIEYCCKQHSYFRIPEIARWCYQDIPADFRWLSTSDYHLLTPDEQRDYNIIRNKYAAMIKQRMDDIKDILPNHWQSKNFGISGVKYLLDLPQEERLKIMKKGWSFPGDLSTKGTRNFYKVSKYYIDKLYLENHFEQYFNYDTNNYNRRLVTQEFNELAKSDKSYLFAKSLYDGAISIAHQMTWLYLNEFTDKEVSYITRYNYTSKSALYDYYNKLQKSYSTNYISAYRYLYNVGFDSNEYPDIITQLNSLSDEDFTEFAHSWYTQKLDSTKYLPYKKGLEPYLNKHNKKGAFVNFRISELDELLEYIRRFEAKKSHARYLDYKKTKDDRKQYKMQNDVYTE